MDQNQDAYIDWNAQMRDFQEKQKLLRDRVLLLGQTLIEERTKTFDDIQEMKKSILALKEETSQIKDYLHKISEHLATTARKEEVLALQRQFDLFRK